MAVQIRKPVQEVWQGIDKEMQVAWGGGGEGGVGWKREERYGKIHSITGSIFRLECRPRCDLSKRPAEEVEDDEKGRTSGRGNQCFNRKNWDSLRPLTSDMQMTPPLWQKVKMN